MFSQHSTISEHVSVKAELVSTLKDWDNCRAYSRFVIEWIVFMANATEKKMTFGQQWYVLVMNVRGSSRL